MSDPRINDRIRVPEVRLVGPAGEQVGIVRIEDALRLAVESDLDLVEVAPTAKPPVCKLMDFGKYKYEAAVKARETRKNQTNTVLKEIRFRLKIDTHDYETKVGHALRFLGAGDKVKAMIQFRGREQQRPEMGIRLLNKFAEAVAEVGLVESTPRIDGRNMVMVVGPLKNKAEAKAEARRLEQRDADKAKAANPKAKMDTSEPQGEIGGSVADVIESDIMEKLAKVRAEAAAEEAAAAAAPKVAPVRTAPAAAKAPVRSAPAREASSRPAASKAPAAARPAVSKPAAAAAPKPAVAAKPAAAPKPMAVPKPMAMPPKPAGKPGPKPATRAPKPGTTK
ncbi:translation initiation factor IF-3 [Paeniglutamicibacter sp. ZC-3]|nr:translation initiation factor IF-3 [Paeniglutamicibacter sp. ZC-3]MCV9994988.1 translation initiation factor IF-3 [Paeniglutamicibacter sp. ZC-3]